MATRKYRFGPVVIWANHDTNAIFHPTSPAMDAGSFEKARCTITLEQDTGAIRAQGAYRYSNDGESWDAAVGVGTEQNGNGTSPDGDHTPISSNARRFIQLGVLALNDATVTALHLGRVWTDWDVRDA